MLGHNRKKMTGAQCLADMLTGYGVTHVFMVPAILRRSLYEMEKRTAIKRLHIHGEKAAAYMADGYARASGRPGICMAQVIGTMNLLAAAGVGGSSVRHIVVKSSTLVYGSAASDPYTFHEDTPRTSPVGNAVERALVEAEGLVRDFSEDNPATRVTVLRFANVLGTHLTTPISRNLSRPVCPAIFGFDPLLQFVEEDDVVRALLHVTQGSIPGLYNVAGDGRLPWSEVASICGTCLVPLSPFSPLKIRPLARLFDLPEELVDLLRYGRGVDTRRLAATGFTYNSTSAGAVRTFMRALRLRRHSGRTPMSYTYEHDVEQFFRHSPSVVNAPAP